MDPNVISGHLDRGWLRLFPLLACGLCATDGHTPKKGKKSSRAKKVSSSLFATLAMSGDMRAMFGELDQTSLVLLGTEYALTQTLLTHHFSRQEQKLFPSSRNRVSAWLDIPKTRPSSSV